MEANTRRLLALGTARPFGRLKLLSVLHSIKSSGTSRYGVNSVLIFGVNSYLLTFTYTYDIINTLEVPDAQSSMASRVLHQLRVLDWDHQGR